MPEGTAIRPAATLVLLRESAGQLETLLLRRKSKSGKGAWVFPGGVVEPQDGGDGDEELAARMAAVRETWEEAGITVDPQSLQLISHWTTPDAPEVSKKRFSTWFFLSAQPVADIEVDNEEIDAYRWVIPEQAIAEHVAGELKMLPPTIVTLTELADCIDAAAAEAFYRRREVPYIAPRLATVDDKICMLYAGDAGYEATDASMPGARNRCWLEDRYWRYEFEEQ
jgi:8-oxo-dGTP pyrophosphatase MutT (NUDIX family)